MLPVIHKLADSGLTTHPNKGPSSNVTSVYLKGLNGMVARWHIFKPKFTILEDLKMEDVGIFCDHLVYCTSIWYILWPSGVFYSYLLHFSRFGTL
jgi:hypothetical protein